MIRARLAIALPAVLAGAWAGVLAAQEPIPQGGASPARKEAPEPSRPKEPADDSARAEAAERVRALEAALWQEVLSLERRLRALKERLRLPEPQPPAPREEPKVDEAALEERHSRLQRRQDELVAKWNELRRSKPGGKDDGKASDRELREIESELRGVLHELLELRESSRARQIARLRSELDRLEGELGARRGREERERAVDSRMKDLLGGKEPGPPQAK